MKCIIKSLLLSTFALFAVLFGSCIITSKSVSAVSDISITYNSSVSSNQHVFPSCDTSSCLSQYSYLVVEHSSRASGIYVITLRSDSFYQSFYLNRDSYYSIYSIDLTFSNDPSFFYFNSSYDFSNDSITFTLTDSLSSCPACPTCPEIPDNPYDNKFDEIKQAILIIPATALVIYFFFCIYRMLLKGRE